MKIRFASLLVLCTLNLLTGRPSEALPGQQLSDLDFSQYSSLFDGRTVQPTSYEVVVAGQGLTLYSTQRYETSGRPVEAMSPDLLLWVDQNNNILFEGLTSGSDSASTSRKLLESDYNPREDSTITSLALSVWNEAVVQDFANSRFTDSFIYQTPRTNYSDSRRIYVGQEYIHELIGGTGNASGAGYLYNLYPNQGSILSELQQLEEFESRQ